MSKDFVCLDSETCGLFGPIVLLQWGEGMDGEIHLWSPMGERIKDTLDIFKWLVTKEILGFNLGFDWFKIQQQMTTLMLLGKRIGCDKLPIDHVDEYALCEPEARDGPCAKPAGALDLMLHARKGPWQNLMARDPITVRRVPVSIAPLVAKELEARVKIPDIFFAKRKKGESRWRLKTIKTASGENPDFVNVELDFAPSSALKALATHELGLDPLKTLVFSDVEVDRKFLPNEVGSAPFALALGSPGHWNGTWPDVVGTHHRHWKWNDLAREYATKDIVYPRALWDKWGRPAFNDTDSLLACLAGSTRWKGFSVDLEGIKKLKAEADVRSRLAPRSPAEAMEFLREKLTPVEQIVLVDKKTGSLTTKKVVLEEITKLPYCVACAKNEKHDACNIVKHPAGERAQMVLDARKGKKEVEIWEKLEQAKRFHVAVNVIGARSSRQSGGQVTEGKKVKKSGGLNPQGIQKKKVVREQFPLAFTPAILAITSDQLHDSIAKWKPDWKRHVDEWAELGYVIQPEKLVGGDFAKFEVCIAAAYYDDPVLLNDLIGAEPPCERGECQYSNAVCLSCKHGYHTKPCDKDACTCTTPEFGFKPTCSRCTGKPSKPGSIKIHAVIGTLVYPPLSYWDVRATDGKAAEDAGKVPGLRKLYPNWKQEHWNDLYTRAKSAFFALLYFGDANTLASRLAIPKEDGGKAYQAIMARYIVMGRKREEFYEKFCPVRQPDGGQVFWEEPDDYVESMTGFKRFFTMENQAIRALYDLAEEVPSEWKDIKVRVMRREKIQTVAGAVRSALYGAAFGLQGSNMRAAGNHKIQSTGATLTKELQGLIWEFQPCGIHPWVARPFNSHDEIECALHPSLADGVALVQDAFLKKHRTLIPLLGMKWKALGTWGGK